MALPRERWYLGRIRDQSDLILALRNLERILARRDEIAGQGANGGAPTDAEYVLGVSDVDLPNGRVLANGVNTTVDYGTPGEVSIDAPAAGAPDDAQYLTAAAHGGLSAEKVFQSGTNTTFATGASTAQVDVADASTGGKGVVQLAGDLAGTAASPVVDGLQTVPVAATAPSTGQVLTYNGKVWTPAAGGGGSSDPLFNEYHPDRPPATIAFGEEYRGNTHNLTWRWANQNDAAEVLDLDAAFLDFGTSGSGMNARVRWFTGSAPGTSFALTLKASGQGMRNASTLVRFGLILLAEGTEASPTRLELIAFHGTLGGSANFSTQPNYVLGSTNHGAALSLDSSNLIRHSWLQLRYDASTMELSGHFSYNGYEWTQVGTTFTMSSHPTSSHGIFMNPTSVTGISTVAHYVRERTDAAGLAGEVGDYPP